MQRRKSTRTRSTALPILASGAAVLALDAARRLYRRSQLFCPAREPAISWNPADYGVPEGVTEEVWFETPDGEILYGWYCRSPKPVASALFCHGNTGNLTTVAEMIPHLLDAGLNVLFFDYRGFGRSSGIASIGGVISDGVTAARFHDSIRPVALPSILYGFSLGGAISAQVVQRHPFDGLILQSTFTSLAQIARIAFPRLPMHLLSGGFFDTLSVIEKLELPLLVMHGTDDEVIPCWMAHRLFEACGHDRKRIQIVENGLHKDLYVRDADALVWAVNQFAIELEASVPAAGPVPSQPPRWSDTALRNLKRVLRSRRRLSLGVAHE